MATMTIPRWKAFLSLLGIVLMTAVFVCSRSGDGGVPWGDALYDDGEGGGGASGPVLPGEPLTFGLVTTWNQSDDPVELVSARLQRQDPDLELLGFTALPFGDVPATAREHPVPKAVELSRFPVQPPADDWQFAVLFGLKIRPGGTAGAAMGVELTYRQGDELRRQAFRAAAYICEAQTLDSDCADRPDAIFGDYDQEVRKKVMPGRIDPADE